MAVKPILFNTEMVRAILSGKKIVTRRVMKPQSSSKSTIYPNIEIDGKICAELWGDGTVKHIKQPYQRGDILWVRETWGYDKNMWIYRADFSDEDLEKIACITKWNPSIHMPREAARIWLRVKKVSVERLREISEEDSVREGLYEGWKDGTGDAAPSARIAFSWVWNTTFSPENEEFYGWAANPWVWVIDFERCEKPGGDADL